VCTFPFSESYDLDCDTRIAELDGQILKLTIEIQSVINSIKSAEGPMQDFLMDEVMEMRNEVKELRAEKQVLRRADQLRAEIAEQKQRAELAEQKLRALLAEQKQQAELAEQKQPADSEEMIKQLKKSGLVGTPVRREKEKEIMSIERRKLYFVNRDNAVDQLQEVHQTNYYRAVNRDGMEWVIPICDNFFGMGKSRLAQVYIERCQARTGTSLELKGAPEFREAINQALTVHIIFKAAELQDELMFEQTLLQKLRNVLIPLFKVAPVSLYKYFPSSDLLLTALIAEAGPLFVALDEIGSAFDISGKDDIERLELFLSFCNKVLRSWLLVPGLFFLVLGRGSFLNYVGHRPGAFKMPIDSPFPFKRLSLQLLKSKSIIEVMKNTFVGETTLFNYYQLSPENAEMVANRLYAQTTGNPRQLLEAFVRCKTYKQLMEYEGSFVIDNYEAFRAYVSNYKVEVDYLLSIAKAKTVIDLRQESTSQGRGTPLETIANNVLIAWEGTLEAAQLVASPTIIEFMAINYLSFREFLKMINRLLEGPVNFPEALEIMVMKRFQEMFAVPSSPKDVLPSFFDSTKFGQFENLVFCDIVLRMGKVTSSASTRGSRLQDLTVNVEAWPSLLAEMDTFTSLCLKPLPLSASSDLIFAGDVSFGSNIMRFTAGIAVKNYKTSEAGPTLIEEECSKFNAMFKGSKSDDRLNVLIFCSTNYGSETIKQFGNQNFFVPATEKYPFIDEVIVLDLSTTAKRAIFFGLAPGDVLNECIDRIIAKDTPYTTPWIDKI
jgi:hypothetical protein